MKKPSPHRHAEWLLVFCTIVIFLGCIIGPPTLMPTLMDDVDAVTAQIARNLIDSGDWVTARLNGIAYFEKPPLRFWLPAVSYLIFGVHDWAARLPYALAAMALCWLTRAIGGWAFADKRAGNWAGIVLSTCVGLFLFTRILIPDVALTLTITAAMWALARALEEDEPHPQRWALLLAASMGAGFLLKGLVAFVFPVGAGLIYLAATRQLNTRSLRRLRPLRGLAVIALLTLPWIALAVWRHPPYFDFTPRAEPGRYHGFFWFFFLNEHLFRYLNIRYPRDYNTVPRAAFWLYHLLWLFPWSVYLPAVARLDWFNGAFSSQRDKGTKGQRAEEEKSLRPKRFFAPLSLCLFAMKKFHSPTDRAGRMRLLCLCWIGCVLGFFTFSTTQEYYSMPAYPAFALLLGAALQRTDKCVIWGTRVAAALCVTSGIVCFVLLWLVRGQPVTGEIADALNYQVSTLSLGRAQELTLSALAYLRLPLATAGGTLLLGGAGALLLKGRRAFAALALMMIVFFHAARLALVTFSPYLGSRPLAEALLAAPPGQLIVDDQYYAFSSIFFYANRRALLLNGRVMNIEYGSYAPGAPDVFINDEQLAARWPGGERLYLTAHASALPRLRALLGERALHQVSAAGGKYLFTNQPLKSE